MSGLLIMVASFVMELGLRRAGFGSCDFRALESGLNSCAAVKSLHAPRHVGSSRTKDRTHVPCVGRWVLNHWTTKEVQDTCFKN